MSEYTMGFVSSKADLTLTGSNRLLLGSSTPAGSLVVDLFLIDWVEAAKLFSDKSYNRFATITRMTSPATEVSVVDEDMEVDEDVYEDNYLHKEQKKIAISLLDRLNGKSEEVEFFYERIIRLGAVLYDFEHIEQIRIQMQDLFEKLHPTRGYDAFRQTVDNLMFMEITTPSDWEQVETAVVYLLSYLIWQRPLAEKKLTLLKGANTMPFFGGEFVNGLNQTIDEIRQKIQLFSNQ